MNAKEAMKKTEDAVNEYDLNDVMKYIHDLIDRATMNGLTRITWNKKASNSPTERILSGKIFDKVRDELTKEGYKVTASAANTIIVDGVSQDIIIGWSHLVNEGKTTQPTSFGSRMKEELKTDIRCALELIENLQFDLSDDENKSIERLEAAVVPE